MRLAGALRRIVVVWAALACGAAGCQKSDAGLTGPQNCTVTGPCDTDPSKTCVVPCKTDAAGAGNGHGAGAGGTAGTGGMGAAGAGGSAGSGGTGTVTVDTTGTVAAFASTAFVET